MIDRLTRIVSRALRHAPDEYGLVLDERGWTDFPALLDAIKQVHADVIPSEADLQTLALDKARFDFRDEQIRALYGHSTVEVDYGPRQPPPSELFHATSTRAFANIAPRGLSAGSRRHVHLTSSWDYALRIYRQRRLEQRGAVLLVIAAAEAAARSGVPFFQASESIWLTPQVGREFISLAVLTRDASDIKELRPLLQKGLATTSTEVLARLSLLLPDD